MERDAKRIVKYTYSTELERMDKVKILAVQEGKPINKLIDEIIDAYLAISE
jgi:hypothetical protein